MSSPPRYSVPVTYVPDPTKADGKPVDANIDPLPAAAAALSTNEIAAYDATWTPHTQKLNVGQIVTLANAHEIVRANALLHVSFGTGQGGDDNFTMGLPGTENDGRVYFSALSNFLKTDPGNNYHGDTSGTGDTDYYQCPVAGWYQILTKLRLIDGTTINSGGVGQGAALPGEFVIGDHDYPDFLWFSVGAAPSFRQTCLNVRIMHCTAGQHLSMVTYSDASGGTGTPCSDGSMAISLLSVD